MRSPGLGRAVAFNVILIGGVSTLLFNGNPLLRFDGYYIFSDLIEIPNLGTARQLLSVLSDPATSVQNRQHRQPGRPRRGEAKWLVAYAVLSFALPDAGVARHRAVPVDAAVRRRHRDGALGGRSRSRCCRVQGRPVPGHQPAPARPPAARRSRSSAAWSRRRGSLLFLIPLPYATVAEGVVVVPEQAEVRAKTEGFVDQGPGRSRAPTVTPQRAAGRARGPDARAPRSRSSRRSSRRCASASTP